MSELINYLQNFNRKERFVVLRTVLGIESEMVLLNNEFRKKLQESLGGDPPVPDRVFVAMDYHLDWIEIALFRAANPNISLGRPFPNPSASEINSNQQDTDLLVAFDACVNGRTLTYLLLVEAKAFTGWNNKQMKSKVDRLRTIFGEGDGLNFSDIALPRLVLMTPNMSKGINHSDWPKWMKPSGKPMWLTYELPSRVKITRCKEDGKKSAEGKSLRLDPIRINVCDTAT